MFRIHNITIYALACMALAFGTHAASAGDKLHPLTFRAPDTTALTIYSAAQPGMAVGYAIVRHDRYIELGKGRTTIRFTDIASQIDPTTVSFESLNDPDGTSVLEQNYEFDLVSADKLTERFLDRTITVEQSHGDKISTFTGTLLSASGGLVLKGDDGSVQVINGYSNIQFPELPGGLITKPTLVWDIAAKKSGQHLTRVMYETKAIGWWADYNIEFTEGDNANSGTLDVGAWVSIINQSGATYADAKLKLVAGEVHRVPRVRDAIRWERSMLQTARDGFEEKSLFEYHLYTLGRATTLPNNSTKQIELFPAVRGVPCDKILVYHGQGGRFYGYGAPMTDRNIGTRSNTKVDIYLQFENVAAGGLGMPLPAGRIRVSQRDPADGSLEFIGEDTIGHTPKDENVLIKLGTAFDVVGERTQKDFTFDARRQQIEETIEVRIRNHKDESVTVVVREGLHRWGNWEIEDSSRAHEKVDAHTIHFPVTVSKDGEAVIQYTVRYSW